MTGARRKNNHVAGTEIESAAAVTAEPDFGVAASDAKHFVNARMIVQIVVDPVTPAIAPAVTFKQVLQYRGRIEGPRQLDNPPIDKNRPSRMVWNPAVIAEVKRASLGSAQQCRNLLGRGTLPPGDPFSRFLELFQQSNRPAFVDYSRISVALSTAAASEFSQRSRGPAARTWISSALERWKSRGVQSLRLNHSPSTFLALPPARAATVGASKVSTAAIWPSGSYSAIS